MDGIVGQPHPDRNELTMTAVLSALADTARLAAVRTLGHKGPFACNRLQQEAGLTTISRTTFSHHQKVLREAGIIFATIQGNERILSLRRDDLNARFPGLLDAVLAGVD
jgi:DNA-binding transcriptional ArsR family regulator